MYRVKAPVFAMAESSFLDGGSRLDDVALNPLIAFSGGRSVVREGRNAYLESDHFFGGGPDRSG
jgi:hypothetical protein